MNPKTIAILITIVCSIFGAIGQIFFKLGSESLKFTFIDLITNYKLIIGLFFYGIATIGYIIALKQANISILYPIIALSYIWVLILAVTFLHEPIPSYKWFGVVGLIISISVISF